MTVVIACFLRGPCLQIREQAGQEFFPTQLRVKGKGNLLSKQSDTRESEADMPPIPRTSPTTLSEPTSTPTQEVVRSASSGLPSLGLDIRKPHQTVHNTSSGWSFDIFGVKLGENHTRSLDSSDSSRFETRVYQPSTQPTNPAASPRDRQTTGPIKRGGIVSTEGGYLSGSSWGHWLCEPNPCGAQVRYVDHGIL